MPTFVLPTKLSSTFSSTIQQLDKLSPKQAGHIRHFHNLATQGTHEEWNHMGGQEPAQEWLDSYRYQIATITYAASLTHYYRLPAARTAFKTLFEQLISKMLMKQVWSYWYLTSQSGKQVDPWIQELRRPWADPIVKENIMYSGHLLLMVTLYWMLFDDDKYNEEGSLRFDWNPLFWGLGPESFSYSRLKLQEIILQQMEENGWLGVCCEPNSIFIVCNQFPLIAVHYNDIKSDTAIFGEVIAKYKAAWEAKGGMKIASTGFLTDIYRQKQNLKCGGNSLGLSPWASAFLNTWDSANVRARYSNETRGTLAKHKDGRVTLNHSKVAAILRKKHEDGEIEDPNSAAAAGAVQEQLDKTGEKKKAGLNQPTLGYVLQWVSEMGDEPMLKGLLKHCDDDLRPTWERGGLYYPVTKTGEYPMDPYTGNAAIAYARLNVVDGQKKMFEQPWTSKTIQNAVWIDALDLASGVDLLRAVWIEDKGLLVLTVREWTGERRVSLEPVVKNLPSGRTYAVYHDEEKVVEGVVEDRKEVVLDIELDAGDEKTVVLVIV